MAGRYGSGRVRNPARARQRVEDCGVVLNLQQVLPDRGLVEGRGIARVGAHSIAYNVVVGDASSVELAFTMKNGAETDTRRQRIALAPSWEPFISKGWWFSCPCCSRRVEKLYLPDPRARFTCRRCSQLIYTSTQAHDARVDRMRRQPRRVVDILSGCVAVGETEYVLALRAAFLYSSCASGESV